MKFTTLMKKRMPTHGEKEAFDIRHIYRWLSLPITYVLYHLGFNAHMVSFLMIAVSIYTAWLIYTGSIILGIILWQVWLILDSVDGEIARLKNRCTSRGLFIDLIFENICFPLNFVAIGYYLSTPISTILGMSLAFLWVLCITTRYNYLECLYSINYKHEGAINSDRGVITFLRYISYGEFKTVVAALALLALILPFFNLYYFLILIVLYLSVRWIIMIGVLYKTLKRVDKDGWV